MQKISLIGSLLGTVLMIYIMMLTGKPLQTQATPNGILDLEFAHTQQKVNKILNAWQPTTHTNQIDAAKMNTYWDFAFLFFYGFLLYNICRLIQNQLANEYGELAILMSKLAISAALLDTIENLGMLAVLHQTYNSISLLIMVGAALLKWFLVILVIFYCLMGLLIMAKNSLFGH